MRLRASSRSAGSLTLCSDKHNTIPIVSFVLRRHLIRVGMCSEVPVLRVRMHVFMSDASDE